MWNNHLIEQTKLSRNCQEDLRRVGYSWKIVLYLNALTQDEYLRGSKRQVLTVDACDKG
jgi:hypothetical protein